MKIGRAGGIALGMMVVLAACGDDGQAPEAVESTFRLEVSGAVTEVAQGPAWFGTDVDEEGEAVFALALGQESSRHLVFAVKPGSARPAPGTYDLEALGGSGWALLHMLTDAEELLGMFVADSGSVTVTASDRTAIRGTVQYWASGFMGDEEAAEIQVSGSFVAVPVESGSTMAGLRSH